MGRGGAGKVATLGSWGITKGVGRQEGCGGAEGSRQQMEREPCGEQGIQRSLKSWKE